mmetsp:Transcript_39947/g.118939  ORF Transcript_39947/g.118939 Transcript_39947/m.118939 type:complete len:117 (-) Transcript_39947:1410-1760(-)
MSILYGCAIQLQVLPGFSCWRILFKSVCIVCSRSGIVPIGEVRTSWNFSLEHKRVLNMVNEVNDSDNIKQDMSIDVYGRQKKEEAAAALAEDSPCTGAAEAKRQQQEEELDQLLTL